MKVKLYTHTRAKFQLTKLLKLSLIGLLFMSFNEVSNASFFEKKVLDLKAEIAKTLLKNQILNTSELLEMNITIALPAPGGVDISGLVNGLTFEFYDAYDSTPEDGISGALLSSGYMSSFTNFPGWVENEKSDNMSLIISGQLEVTTSGNYDFRLADVDDDAALFVNGNLIINQDCCGTSGSVTVSGLPAGLNDIEVRYGESGGGQGTRVEWNGSDSGNSWENIPDAKLFTTAELTAWYKSNLGVTGSEGGNATAWTDNSTNGNDLTLINGDPVYYATTANELANFHPVVNFMDDRMEGPDNVNGLPLGDQGKTIFSIVTKEDNLSNTGWITSIGQDAGGKDFGLYNNNQAVELTNSSNFVNGSNFFSELSKIRLISGTVDNVNIVSNNNNILYREGVAFNTGTFSHNTSLNDNREIALGAEVDHSGSGFDGKIMEVIYYPWVLSDLERQRVQSYLGIKYGLNLPHDYLDSGASIIYDTTSYANDITGIGRDDDSGLDQRQSKSANNNGVVIYHGDQTAGLPVANADNTSPFSADKTFMLWGHNGESAGYTTPYSPSTFTPTEDYSLMQRVWKIQETGTVGTITIQGPNSAEHIFVHNSIDFTTGSPTELPLVDNGNGNKIAVVNFTDGHFFTFGREVIFATPCANSGGVAFIHGSDDAGDSGVGISAWVSNGDGTFDTQEISFAGFDRDESGTEVFGNNNNAATYFADINKDGFLDIIHATEDNGNAIYVWLNNGNNTFQTTAIATIGMATVPGGQVFAGETNQEQGWLKDSNADGNLDYIFSGNNNQIHVFLGNGDGTFQTTFSSTTLTGTTIYATSGVNGQETFLVEDVNGDASVDLIGTFDPGRIQVWLGNGDGTFNPSIHFDATIEDSGTSSSSGSADNEYSDFSDVNNDGFLDFLHAESFDGNSEIWAFLNNGDGTFVTTAIKTTITVNPPADQNRFANYTSSEQSFFFDVTTDGIVDYITTNDNGGTNSGFSVYSGNGDGTFAATPINTLIPNKFGTGVSNVQTSAIACGVVFRPEICNNGIDDDGDGLVDCTDDFCTNDLACNPAPAPTACTADVAYIHGSDDSGTSGVGLSVWISNGDGTFNSEELSFAGFDRDDEPSTTEVFGDNNNASTFYGDVNNDGFADIVHATEDDNNSIHVWLSNGDNTFASDAIVTSGISSGTDGQIFAGLTGSEQGWLADVNGDNRLDYIFSGNDSQVHVYLGFGDGTFAKGRISSCLAGSPFYKTSGFSGSEQFLLADVTGDNIADIVGTYDDSGTGRLQVWKGIGDGRFESTPFFDQLLQDSGTSNTSGSGDGEFSAFVDADNDGDLDYAHAEDFDGTMDIWIFRNNGDGTFVTTAVRTVISGAPLGGSGKFASFTDSEQSFFADVNKDGAADYMIATDNSGANNGFSVYLSNGNGTYASSPINTQIGTKFATGTNNVQTTTINCGVFVLPEICSNGIDDDGDGLVDCADDFCTNNLACPAAPEPGDCSTSVALLHGADDNGTSGLGLSTWISNNDGTFEVTEVSFSGFDRDNMGTEVFGDNNNASTYFGDVDNDGNADIVHATEDNNNSIYVWLSNGDNTFSTTAIVTTGLASITDGHIFAGLTGAEQGWLADVNGDNRLDYVFSGDDAQIHSYIGYGDGTFAKTRITSCLGSAGGRKTSGFSGSEQFFLGDVNGDNIDDLVGTYDDSGTGRLQVWEGYGDGRFKTAIYFNELLEDTGSSNSSGSGDGEYSAFVDVDNDGDIDYVHAEDFDSTMDIWVYFNNGDGTFQTNALRNMITNPPLGGSGKFASFTNAEQSFFADIDKDGDADYIIATDNSGGNNGISVYLSNGDGTYQNSPVNTIVTNNFAVGTDGQQTTTITCGVVFKTCLADTYAPPLSTTTFTNVCPTATANLDSLHTGSIPVGTSLVWSTDNISGDGLSSTESSPTSNSGTYYAYYYDAVNDCYSPSTTLTVNVVSCIPIDSDGDGISDDVDPDDDNDGILDIAETGDTDGDGIPDSLESNIIDTDGDGLYDYADSNADGQDGNDGLAGEQNGVETGPWNDSDNDGIPDHLDGANGSGSGTNIAGSGDSDGDGLSDSEECPGGYICPDSDDDGIPDYMDNINGPDTDNDGIGDLDDLDDDNDGILDLEECPIVPISFSNVTFTNQIIDIGGDTVNVNGILVVDVGSQDGNAVGDLKLGDGANDNPPIAETGDHYKLEVTNRNVKIHIGGHETLSGGFGNGTGSGANGDELLFWATGGFEVLDPDNQLIVTNIGIDTIRVLPAIPGMTAGVGTWSITTIILVNELNIMADGDPGLALNVKLSNSDLDGDNIANCLDLDSDNDGIYDADEAGHGEPNTNGRLTGGVNSTNGIDNDIHNGSNGINYTVANSENPANGNPDYLDTDSDDDNCNDTDEANVADTDMDGIAGTGTPTVDADGLVTNITYMTPCKYRMAKQQPKICL